MPYRSSWISVLLLTLVAGCAPQGSVIKIDNSTGETICVEDISPLEYGVGPKWRVLGKSASTSHMPSQVIPEELTVTWWIDNGDGPTAAEKVQTKARVSNFSSCNRRDYLVLEYRGKATWNVWFLDE